MRKVLPLIRFMRDVESQKRELQRYSHALLQLVKLADYLPEQMGERRTTMVWDEGPDFAINRSTVGASIRMSMGLGEDELEEARGGIVYDEKSIISSATPLLSRAA